MLAKADTGASQHYWTHRDIKVLTKVTPMIDRPMVKLPDSTVIQATHKGTILLHPTLFNHVQQAHSFPKITNSSLISIGQICDDNKFFKNLQGHRHENCKWQINNQWNKKQSRWIMGHSYS